MTLHIAMTFDHMEVDKSNLHSHLGLYDYSSADNGDSANPNDGYSRITVGADGKLTTVTNLTGSIIKYVYLPKVTARSPEESPFVVIGARFGQTDNSANTNLMLVKAGTVTLSALTANVIGPNGGYVEFVLDRTNGQGLIYRDGIHVGQIGVNASMMNAIKTVTEFHVAIAKKNYSWNVPFWVRDIYVLECDDVYPNSRLGAVNIRAVPVVVDSVNGFDKDAIAVQSSLGQKITSADGSPWVNAGGVVKSSALSGELGFHLDTSSVPVAGQIAAAVFIGARRQGATMITTALEKTQDGISGNTDSLDLSPLGAERIKYCRPFAVKSAIGDAKSISDVTFKFKFQGE